MKIKLVDENLVGQPGLCPFIDPKTNWVRDIDEYDVAIYVDRMCFIQPINPEKTNYAWIIEPPIINGENYINIVKNKNNFKYIFTHIKNILQQTDNAVYIPHGGTWLREEDIKIYDKNKLVSFIFSNKEWNPYHRMRHRVKDRFTNDNRVDFYGSGSDTPIQYKIEGLKDYRFSIVIENSIESDYFTEKLLDCFLSGTIPIYVGHRNISEYFDCDGVIHFEGDEDLPEILDTLSEDLYNSKFESVKRNFELAQQYIHPETRINEIIFNEK
jgi:hypothetical protein